MSYAPEFASLVQALRMRIAEARTAPVALVQTQPEKVAA